MLGRLDAGRADLGSVEVGRVEVIDGADHQHPVVPGPGVRHVERAAVVEVAGTIVQPIVPGASTAGDGRRLPRACLELPLDQGGRFGLAGRRRSIEPLAAQIDRRAGLDARRIRPGSSLAFAPGSIRARGAGCSIRSSWSTVYQADPAAGLAVKRQGKVPVLEDKRSPSSPREEGQRATRKAIHRNVRLIVVLPLLTVEAASPLSPS